MIYIMSENFLSPSLEFLCEWPQSETHFKVWRRLLLLCIDVLFLLNGKPEERVACNWFYIGGFVII